MSSACPSGYIYKSDWCVDLKQEQPRIQPSCPLNTYIMDDGTCSATCSSNYTVDNNYCRKFGTSLCSRTVDRMDVGTFYPTMNDYGNCMILSKTGATGGPPDCSSGKYILDNGYCSTTCPVGYSIDTKVNNKNNLIGTPCRCAQDKYIMKDTGECVEKCPYGYYSDFQLGNNYCIKSASCCPVAFDPYNQTCYSPECGTDFLYDPSRQKCLYTGTHSPAPSAPVLTYSSPHCPINTYTSPSNLCVSSCPLNTSLQHNSNCVPSQPLCDVGQYFYVDEVTKKGSCVYACPKGYVQKNDFCTNTVNAQFITITQTQTGIIALSGIEVYASMLNPGSAANPNLITSNISITFSSIDSTSKAINLIDSLNSTLFLSDTTHVQQNEYVMLDLGTIFPIAQIIVRNRSDGIQQGYANGLAVTLATTSGIVFVSDLFKDVTGSTVYSDKSLSYKTFTIYPPVPTVIGSDIVTPCPQAYDATNRLCYSPICGTDFEYDSSSKTCSYTGTTVPKPTPPSLMFTPNAQCPITSYITSDNRCVLTCPEHTSIQGNTCEPISVPIPTRTVTQEQLNEQNKKLILAISIPTICCFVLFFIMMFIGSPDVSS